MKYLLDTNILIYLDKRAGNCSSHMQRYAQQDIVLCAVSVMEIEYGLARSQRPEHLCDFMQSMRQRHGVLNFDTHSAEQAGRVKAHLAAIGQPIGPFDLQIAGIALANKLTVVTHNTREFSRVPGLQVEDWYEAAA